VLSEAGHFYKGLEEHWAKAEAGMPVAGEASGGEAEELGAHLRENEETGVIDDELETSLASGCRPADELAA